MIISTSHTSQQFLFLTAFSSTSLKDSKVSGNAEKNTLKLKKNHNKIKTFNPC